MAGIRFPELVSRFVATLERQGATVLLGGDVSRRPATVHISFGGKDRSCQVFLWTITPGGGGEGVRPAHERRIQITNVEAFPLLPGERTVIGGFAPDEEVWCFWDPRRHSQFSQRSPSLQVHVGTLQRAGHDGIATQTRPSEAGPETVVATAPESLLWFMTDGDSLHNAQGEDDLVHELVAATPEVERDAIDSSQSPEEAARRYELVEVVRAFRDSRFRPAVLQAYSYRCAISGVALKLVDAAHIVPVAHPRGSDDVTNGIALSRTLHGAYDNGLLGIQSDGRLVLNPDAISRLTDARLVAGLEQFRDRLPTHARFPASREVQPDPERLRLSLRVRGFPEALIA